MLEPEGSYDALRPALTEITRLAGQESVAMLLRLAAGERPRLDGLPVLAAETLERAAEMEFELRTPTGGRVGADVVRVIDLGNGSPARVAAQFRMATADSPSWLPEHEGTRHDNQERN